MQQTATTRPTSVDLATARTLAGIAERAAHLFTPGHKDGGYRAKPFETNPTCFFVFPPDTAKPVYIVDTTRQHCTCPSHAENGTCKHYLALMARIEDDRRADEAEEFAAYGRYDFEDNAEQMNQRPNVPAYFTCTGQPVYR